MDKEGSTDQEQQGTLHCSECHKSFSSDLSRRRHESTCNKNSWRCKLCNKELSSKRNLNNHEVSCKRKMEKLQQREKIKAAAAGANASKPSPTKASRYVCGVCDEAFPSIKTFQRHRQSHYKKSSHFTCSVCQQQFPTRRELAAHFASHPSGSWGTNVDNNNSGESEEQQEATTGAGEAKGDSKKTLKCVDCDECFDKWYQLLNHRVAHHNTTQSNDAAHAVQAKAPWKLDPSIKPPWIEVDEDGRETINTAIKAVYEEFQPTIESGHDMGKVRASYNFPINDFNGGSEVLHSHLIEIYSNEKMSFKINLAFGVILRNVETGEYRYFTAYLNSTVMDKPYQINNRNDLIAFFRHLEGMDLMEHVLKSRLSTKWQKVFVTNVNFYLYRTSSPLGALKEVELPDYIRNKRSIIGFHKTREGIPYQDNLCIFRCLTYAERQGRCPNFENLVKGCYTVWKDFLAARGNTDLPIDARKYKGISFAELPDFEECFNARVTVYSLHEDKSCTHVYASSLDPRVEAATEVNLNLYESHFSYITKFDEYASKYACGFCRRTFKRISLMKKHTKVCDSRVKFKYPGGLYLPCQTVFDDMQQMLGLEVEKDLQSFPFFAVYDFEAMLKKIPHNEEGEEGTRWITQHVPICVSVNSNVPGYDSPHCIIDSDPDQLVKRMCDYLTKIQSVASALAADRWRSVFEDLEKMKTEFPSDVDTTEGTEAEDHDEEYYIQEVLEGVGGGGGGGLHPDDNGGDDVMEDNFAEKFAKIHARRVSNITDKFKKYTSVLPVLGFNSSRYDLNLIKSRFPKHLNLATEADYVIKKCNEYSAIATSKFRFLDISNFLAAGCSYARFLKAYDVAESKSYFPYEFLDDESKLDYPSLPQYEAFHSSLRNANVLEAEHTEWIEHGCVGEPPKTGQQKYEELLAIWQDRGMTRLADFLEFYVNLDTGPFVEAAEKLRTYYLQMGVDVFKTAISAPGVARKLLFEHAKKSNIHFASFSEENADLYQKLKRCAFGGPSIVFKRYAKVDETHIRNNEEVKVKNIVGYDCNSLYLFAMGEELPVLFPIRRLEEKCFFPQVSWKYLDSYLWMNWLMKCDEGLHIQHKLNSGRDFPVGPYKLDGYALVGNRQVAFEYNGCWVHGHDPGECKYRTNANTPDHIRALLHKRNQATKTREMYLRSLGYEVISMYECEFQQMRKEQPEIRSVSKDLLPEFYMAHPYRVSVNTILSAVESGELTGMVEVDIRVPEVWPEGKERDMTPHEYFAEMSPLFCNAEVHFDDWGPTMQNYSMSHQAGEFSDRRKLLIGGMAATKIFLATNLLKWYLEKGLEVTHVYQVVEFQYKKCFADFCNYISEARRQGDADPSKEILGETCKTLGNASYGSLLLDKTKHINVKYVDEKSQAHLAVNEPLFRKLSELPNNIWELEMSKKVVNLDLPLQLAFAILNTAKLVLLRFYYDFLDVFVDRKNYEVTHADTDSLYFTLSGNSLSDVIQPDKREEFERSLVGHCNDHPFKASAGYWFPRQCCQRHKSYDKRERGLFKLEASGTELIALASKTYYLRRPGTKDSVKCKGINKSSLVEPRDMYNRALFEKVSSSVRNIGFRARDNTIQTYSQSRRGFSFFYVKRVVEPNGIDTRPLQITLNPWEDFNVIVLDSRKHCISNDFQATMVKEGNLFLCCTQMFLYEKAIFNGCPDVADKIHASTTMRQMHLAAKRIQVRDSWYDHRDAIMEAIIEMKVRNIKVRIVRELREMEGKMIVHPGSDNYWSCGLSKQLAEFTPPMQFPGTDALARIWERLSRNNAFMND